MSTISTPQEWGISNSEVQTWKRCRRKWYAAYYLNLGTKPSETSMAGVMHLGIRVHNALERYYGHGEDPLKVEQELYEHGLPIITERNDEKEMKDYEGDHVYAQKMIEGYLQWITEEGMDADYEVIAAEQEVRVPSGIPGIDLRGKLDVRLRRRTDGRRVFMDHKTAGSVDIKTIEINEQFPMYALLERLLPRQQGEPTHHSDGGVINVLKRVKRTMQAKPPFYKRHEVRFNPSQLRSMWARVHAVIIEIMAARKALAAGGDHHAIVYPTPAGDCDWSCPFFKVCPMFDDGSRVEAALEEHYVTIDPYARYETRSAE